MRKRAVSIAALGLAAMGIAACGSGSGAGRATINLYTFPEPSGSFASAAKDCSAASHGSYKININVLPSAADAQRTNLVRRLAAKDSSIDLMTMDVIWTPEFAAAGWIKQWTGANKAAVTNGVLPGPIKTATWQGKLYAAPFNSNTQLLWYRKDLVPNPPTTWAEMIAQAKKLSPKENKIEIQGAQYEGFTVWFNSLVNSAGGKILSPDGKKVVLGPPAAQAAAVINDLAHSSAADPSLSNEMEDQNRLAFESGTAAFELNYPFVYPSAKTLAPKIFKNMGYALWPGVAPGHAGKGVSIGGSNLGVGAYSKHLPQAFAAAACLRNSKNQIRNANGGGLPPVSGNLYDDPALAKNYPFHQLIKEELANASVRPQTPLYSDVSLAIQKTLSPPGSGNPKTVVKTLTNQIKQALGGSALL
ncbi:MAG: transporter substrate-binding protein [Solirubrobacterales bacterium]|jgi:multiple sugar transport system substrate-binding protein|nr:transporter substrate-binding protein [Solirubrobacterales bacterium]